MIYIFSNIIRRLVERKLIEMTIVTYKYYYNIIK